ncbi:MAG TPA: alginate export family protein [Candidatus Manganitrophaceae bacterium]|nr:alginate export family protein [Candidatus Manganitrophaceae bacterium]
MKKRIVVIFKSSLFFLACFTPLYAEDLPAGPITTAAERIHIGGQGRIRYQSFPAPPSNENDFFTNYRFRLNVDVTIIEGVSFFLQPQKVGVFGNGETGAAVDVAQSSVQTDPSTGVGTGVGDLTLHQAYVDFTKIGGVPLALRLGRFEYILGGHRLIGNFDWSQRARSFEGALLSFAAPSAGTLSLFGFRLAGEKETGPLPAGDKDADTDLLGIHFGSPLLPMSLTEVTLINDRKLAGLPDSNRYTAGIKIERSPVSLPLAFISPHVGPIWRAEYYRQWGDRSAAQEIDASLYALRLGYRFDAPLKPMILLGWESLSGDEDVTTGDYKAFDTLYATNHLYYGQMDYFVAIPADTQGRGLRDAFFRVHLTPWEKAGFAMDGHVFSLQKEIAGERDLGKEVDITFLAQTNKVTSVMIGYSKLFSEKGMELLGRVQPGANPDWAFVMMNVSF